MNPDRWRKIEQIHDAALELENGRREAYLAEACARDDGLREEVEALLRNGASEADFMQAPAMEFAARALAEERVVGQEVSLTGRAIAHYKVMEKLGAGGMGVVYKAQDTHLNRLVALKVLPPEMLADPERKRRFVREARAASALNHPNIVTIHDIDQAGGIDYIAMEYIPGLTLSDAIPRTGMRLEKALKIGVQIADALASAHAAGIIHRDLKPGNIIVGDDGRTRVLDFGLAKLTETVLVGDKEPGATTESYTEEGTILGTAPYMSPEQAQGKPVDGRSDIFSFGSMFYEMVTGRRAFEGDSKISTLSKILNSEPAPIAKVVPPDLTRIIQKCLRKEPERRFQHIDDVKSELQDLIEESGKPAEAAPPAAKQKKLVWLLAGAVVLAALAGTIWWLAGRFFVAPSPRLLVQPLTSYPGIEGQPSLSPDGKQVAFNWNGPKQDNFDIYVQQVKGGPPLRLTTDPANDISPAWSPDGSEIAFVRELPSLKISLNLISPLGGPERIIAEFMSGYLRIAWTPDGKWLVASERLGSVQYRLVLINVATREKKPLVTPPVGDVAMDYHCTFSPDGMHVAFVRQTDWQFCDIWVAPFPAGDPRRLTHDNKTASYNVWTPNGKEIIFRSNRLGSFNLWRISADAESGTEPILIPDTEGVGGFALSKGPPARLVFSRGVIDINIWATEILPDKLNYGPPKPVIQSTREDRGAQFSPDGRRIVYTSGRAGELGIWIAASDGSNPIQLTTNNVSGAKDWSPDGSKIAFDYLQDLYIMDASGGEPRPVLKGPASNNRPHWSRDGRWLYFHSDRSGTRQIWKMPAAGGEPMQVTRGGGIEGWEAPDGKMLYYTRSWDAPGLWVVSVDGGEEKPALDAVWHSYWAMADAGIYFVDFVISKSPTLRFFDFKTRKVKGILVMDKVTRATTQNLTVTRDGRKIAWHQMDRSESDLMQIENFR